MGIIVSIPADPKHVNITTEPPASGSLGSRVHVKYDTVTDSSITYIKADLFDPYGQEFVFGLAPRINHIIANHIDITNIMGNGGSCTGIVTSYNKNNTPCLHPSIIPFYLPPSISGVL